VSPIASLLLVISVGFPVQNGLSDIGSIVLGEVYVEVYVYVHNRGCRDVLPCSPCLQSLKFVQRSEHRSGKRNFVAQEA